MPIDLVTATDERRYVVAIVVSRHSVFGSAVRLAKEMTSEQSRSLVIESAFPVGLGNSSKRGVQSSTSVPIEKTLYDPCLDFTDYRPSAP